jgi:hypothetical protein
MATPEEVELARVWAPEIGAGRAEEPDSIQEAIGCAWFLHGTSDSHLLAAFHLFEAYEWGIYKKWETDNTGGESKNDPAPAAASDRANREHEEKGENHHG